MRACLGGGCGGLGPAFVDAEGVAFVPGFDTARVGGGDTFLDVDWISAESRPALAGWPVEFCTSLAGTGEAFFCDLSSPVGSSFLFGTGVPAGVASFEGANCVLSSFSSKLRVSL